MSLSGLKKADGTLARDWNLFADRYLRLFADCIPVKGAFRSAIYDLTRHEIILFPSDYYRLIDALTGKRLADLLDEISNDTDRDSIIQFLDYLDENEVLMLVQDLSQFPNIEDRWDYPGAVQNAVIDLAGVMHDFRVIFDQLTDLGCQHLQIRSFSNLLTLSKCSALLEDAQNRSFTSIELILRFADDTPDDVYLEFLRNQPLVSALTIHSAPYSKVVTVDYTGYEGSEQGPRGSVRFTQQKIDDATQCGIITERYLTPPTVKTFFEAKSWNGCLNRKIAIDANGNVKNCPSMSQSFGDCRNTPLMTVVQDQNFIAKWKTSKDSIAVCSDCEFRYACSDCRAYLEHPENPASKPLKCGYDPYTGQWNKWAIDPSKAAAARLYHIVI